MIYSEDGNWLLGNIPIKRFDLQRKRELDSPEYHKWKLWPAENVCAVENRSNFQQCIENTKISLRCVEDRNIANRSNIANRWRPKYC